MNLDEFEKNVITQKDYITKKELIAGGLLEGTQTSKSVKTRTLASTILEVIYGNDYGTKTDHYGDWSDEGTC